jgi:hypothetical protein
MLSEVFHELSVPHTQVLSEVFLSLELVVFFDGLEDLSAGTCKVI